VRLWWKGIVSKEDVRGKGGRGVAQMEADVIQDWIRGTEGT